MNWDRVRSEDNVRRYGSERITDHYPRATSKRSPATGARARARNRGIFRLKFETPCSTCGVVITVGNAAKLNVIGQVVHPKGCPKKG